MLQFDPLANPYPSRRNVIFSNHGMVASTSPMASSIGQEILRKGGNAVDAAIAMAVTFPLVEPTGNGLGSDCFVLIWNAEDQKLYGLNGSGVAPRNISAEAVRQRSSAGAASDPAAVSYSAIPREGWCPVMVPGAPKAWAALRERFGTFSMWDLMAPAMELARSGFPIPVNVALQWEEGIRRFRPGLETNPDLFTPWFSMFTKDGAPYLAGDIFRCPDYARTLESLARSDCASYYTGEIMEQIVAFSARTGGFFTEKDFREFQTEWVEPISVRYRGYDVFEMPPNGHGITALMALNILKGLDLPAERDSALSYHLQLEAIKLAFADTKKYVADPRYMRTKVSDLLSDRYADARRALITNQALFPEAGDPSCGGTVYFCTADQSGNMVSFIQSNYNGFGSGVVIPDTGISLQNRGANFSLDPESDNFLEGGKRSYHTIIPGFLCRDGKPIGPFGVMGAFMQPQGHVQVVVNTIDYHMNPQQALDAPRFQWVGGKHIQLEPEVPSSVADELSRMGHEVEIVSSRIAMGRGQIIWRREDGLLTGGTEPRADGFIAIT